MMAKVKVILKVLSRSASRCAFEERLVVGTEDAGKAML